jgi:hypothetical protein
MSFLLYQDNNIVGVFDEINKARDMANGIIENGWAKDFHIVQYKLNTCCKGRTINIENKEDVNNYQEINSDSDDSSDSGNMDSQEAEDLQKKLNVLKLQKEKIEESKTKYEVDVKLYYDFKKKLETDNTFTIPELFVEKYKIFHQLDIENNISWESFSLLYKEPDFYGKFSNIFEVTNSFENRFLQNTESDTEASTESSHSSNISEDSDNIIEIIQVINSSDEDNSSSD